MSVPRQCKDIPDVPILAFLDVLDGKWATHGEGYSMPTVRDAMPEGTPERLQRAKMAMLLRRDLVHGCPCGCRGDWEITPEGRAFLVDARMRTSTRKAEPAAGVPG